MATTITGTTIDVGTNVIVTDSAGNVGIGTSSPASSVGSCVDATGNCELMVLLLAQAT